MAVADAPLSRLVECVRHARDTGATLQIRGGGSKSFYGGVPQGALLETGELRGISSYEPTELVVTARAATPLAELESELLSCGQILGFEPPRFAASSTVGGMVAAGLSGPARASVGSVRDHVLGMTVLNGNAELLSFGGQVAKNVAGYDVARVMVGALGILGVICEVSLKVLPIPVAAASLTFEHAEADALEQLCSWRSRPLPINASAWCDGRLHVRLSGAAAAVAEAKAQLGGEAGAQCKWQGWWADVRDQRHEFFTLGAARLAAGECLWRLSVPAATAPLRLPGRQFIEWHGAQRWWSTHADAGQVRETAARAGGHATLMRAADKSAGVFQPLTDVLLRVHRGLKHAFDPHGIFNPGRLYPGL